VLFLAPFAIILARVAAILLASDRRRRIPPEGPVRTLVVLGSGGHTAEMMQLTKKLCVDRYAPVSFVVAATDNTSVPKVEALRVSLREIEFHGLVARPSDTNTYPTPLTSCCPPGSGPSTRIRLRHPAKSRGLMDPLLVLVFFPDVWANGYARCRCFTGGPLYNPAVAGGTVVCQLNLQHDPRLRVGLCVSPSSSPELNPRKRAR